MRHITTALLIAAVPVLFTACGKNSSNLNPVDNVREASKDSNLQNRIFRGDCSLKPLDTVATGIATGGDTAIKSARVQYEFVGANVTHATLLYTTSDCTGTPSVTFRETGSFIIDTDHAAPEGSRNLDLKYDHLHVTIGDDNGAKIANDVKLCENTDWAKNKDRDVTEHAADLTCYHSAITHKATIYLLQDNVLMFGAKGMLDKDDTRPTSLNKDDKYVAG